MIIAGLGSRESNEHRHARSSHSQFSSLGALLDMGVRWPGREAQASASRGAMQTDIAPLRT